MNFRHVENQFPMCGSKNGLTGVFQSSYAFGVRCGPLSCRSCTWCQLNYESHYYSAFFFYGTFQFAVLERLQSILVRSRPEIVDTCVTASLARRKDSSAQQVSV